MFKKSNFKYLAYALVFLSVITSCDSKGSIESATDLTISEGFKNPLGFYDANPTFSCGIRKKIITIKKILIMNPNGFNIYFHFLKMVKNCLLLMH